MARGGLLNEIQKVGAQKEQAVVAKDKEVHAGAAKDMHAELLQGASLKSVGVDSRASAGPSDSTMLRGGLMNEIAKGMPLNKVNEVGVTAGANDGGVKSDVMLRGGLMNEIAKGTDLKPTKAATPKSEITLARAGLLNEINKKRVDDEEEDQKVSRALHEAQSGDLMGAIQSGLTLKNVKDAADGGVNVQLVLRGGLMFEIANMDSSKLRSVGVTEGDNCGSVKTDTMLQGGLLNQIAKGAELKTVPVTQLPKDKSTDVMARGGLLNEIQKVGAQKEEAVVAKGKEEHAGAAKDLHAELASGVKLNKVESKGGGVSDEIMMRGGLMNEIAKGKELAPVGDVKTGPSEEVMARGGLMNEIAKGKDLKYIHDDRKNHRDEANPELHKE